MLAFLLILTLLAPLIAVAIIAAGGPAKASALVATAFTLLATTVLMIAYDKQAGGYQFASSFPILESFQLNFALAVDGLSLMMLLLTALVSLCAVWVTPPVERSENLFYISLLLISAGAIGAFISTDLFFFYAFHELALIPTFLLIGIWGSGNRQAAAWKITIYLAIGSFILLLGLVALYQAAGANTLSIPELVSRGSLSSVPNAQWIYLLLLVGFGILVSLFPFHTWAPQAYASAPSPAAMLHAGVLKKFGLYGLLRLALPLFPEEARQWNDLLVILLIGNILYVGLATIAQKQLDMTLGYSSVMHMGYIFLGLVSMNSIGLSGAALLMFAHGLSIAALFAITGEIRRRTGTLDFLDVGGLAKTLPFLSFTFGIALFASIGLPGFGNFAAELLVFFGAFAQNNGPGEVFTIQQIATVVGLWGVVISAVYMLRAYRTVFMGTTVSRWANLSDLVSTKRLPIVLLITMLLVVGCYPRLILDYLPSSLAAIR